MNQPKIQLGVDYDSKTQDIKWTDFLPNERNQSLIDVLKNIFSRLPNVSKIGVGCLNLGIFHFFKNCSSYSIDANDQVIPIQQDQIDEMGYQLAKELNHHDQNWRVEFFYHENSKNPNFFAETPLIKEYRKRYQSK